MTKLTDIISKKLEQKFSLFGAVSPNWKSYETSEPTLSSEVLPESAPPPVNFGVPLAQNDMNDNFDTKELLSCVPKLYKQKAFRLLELFERQPNDVSFDSKGTVYINSESLPNSNIYKILPALFKNKGKSVNGLKEVVQKLDQMNLTHLINRRPTIKVKTPSMKIEPSKNWWYLN